MRIISADIERDIGGVDAAELAGIVDDHAAALSGLDV